MISGRARSCERLLAKPISQWPLAADKRNSFGKTTKSRHSYVPVALLAGFELRDQRIDLNFVEFVRLVLQVIL